MKIKELSEITGFGISTIYDYIKQGLLHPPYKKGPTKSYFDNSHIERLNLIKRLKNQEKLSKNEIIKKINTIADIPNYENQSENIKIVIIDKALKLFSEKGYDNTKITEITDSLDMASGTFYRFFNSKEELLIACMDRLPKVLIPKQAWAKVVKEKNYIKRLRNRGYAMMNAFPSYIGILNHIRLLLVSENKDIAKKAAECLKNVIEPLKNELEFAIKQGAVRKVDTDFVSYILLGINSIYGDRMLIDSKYSVDEAFSIIEDFVYHALVNKDNKIKWNNIIITFINNEKITLNDIEINKSKYIYGHFKEGELSFHINDIKNIKILKISNNILIKIIDTKNMEIKLNVDIDTYISGIISKGLFKIKLSKISSIDFKN